MNNLFNGKQVLFGLTLMCFAALFSCEPPVKLASSWYDNTTQPVRFSRVLVVSFARDAIRQKLGEDHIKAELMRHGLTAVTSLDEFGAAFADADSARQYQLLLDRKFDGMVTFKVLAVDEQDRWEPGSLFFQRPGYSVIDIDVLLESKLYRTANGQLLWTGQSKSFTNEPTDAMATLYARNIVKDMIHKKVLAAPH